MKSYRLSQNGINIYDHVSPITFLEDLFLHHKKADCSFTYEKWSDQLGFKSRGFLKLILSKKRRITSSFINQFTIAYELDLHEKEYFHFLTLHARSTDPTEKSLFLNKLYELKGRARQVLSDLDQEKFLDLPEIPHIQTLLSFKDFVKTSSNIANILGLDEEKALKSLQQLESLGVVEKETPTTWSSKYDFFKVKSDHTSKKLREYHNFSLNQAIAAQNLPFDLRRFKSFLVPLSPSEFELLVQQMQEFVTKSLTEYGKSELDSRRLYKINLNLYPVSQMHSRENQMFSNLNTQSGLQFTPENHEAKEKENS